jgi:hypothetical protein
MPSPGWSREFNRQTQRALVIARLALGMLRLW